MKRARLPVGAVFAVAVRPRLWPTAVRQARALAVPGWWRHPPFLPLPDRAWMEFRLTTAYGDPGASIDPDDLIVWLDWSRRQRGVAAEIPEPRIRVHR